MITSPSNALLIRPAAPLSVIRLEILLLFSSSPAVAVAKVSITIISGSNCLWASMNSLTCLLSVKRGTADTILSFPRNCLVSIPRERACAWMRIFPTP